jgi:hypothetical protein
MLSCRAGAAPTPMDPHATHLTSLPSASIRINYSGLTTTSPLPNPNNPIAQIHNRSSQSRAEQEVKVAAS